MSLLLSCRGASLTLGTKPLFKDLSFSIESGERIGVVGHNGCGKSSLLRILAGQQTLDGGDFNTRRGLRVEFVEQFLPADLGNLSVRDTVLERLSEEEQQTDAWRADVVLDQMRFRAHELDRRTGDLSGGQQNRVMLARALIREPDLLLLDEPTNHLDIVTVRVIEQFLVEELSAALLLVSHDRQFLDAVTTRTLILRDLRAYAFDMPCSRARHELAEADVAAAETRRAEEKNIERLRASAKRLHTWGRVHDNEKLIRRARSMQKRVERLEEDRTFVSQGSGLNLQLDTASTRANRVLRIEAHTVQPPFDGAAPLYTINELVIQRGERVVLLGANGCGKSTLIRELVERYRTAPEDLREIAFNPQVSLGYYDQELDEVHADCSILEHLIDTSDAPEREIRNALIHAGFPWADQGRRVSVLSGGERARILFVRLALLKPNLLILDEPTNHIDMEGRETLEQQLLEAGATVLMTSHDRRFIETVANRFLMVEDGRLVEINDPGEFLDALDEEIGLPAPGAQPAQASGAATNEAAEEELLERLVDLEEKLAADLARKPKFQKPDLQARWRQEIDELNRQLQAQ